MSADARGAEDPEPTVAVFYLARGREADHLDQFAAFLDAYRRHPAGHPHRLHVIFKGFADAAARAAGAAAFAGIDHAALDTDDLRFDLGAYADAARQVEADVLCFLNTFSQILSPNWLAKLVRNLGQPGVGMVGATGSFESLAYINRLFPPFPNPHLRSNAFALRRRDALALFERFRIRDKLDCFLIESGPDSLTRQVFATGQTCLIVGADGRGFEPERWPVSETARQGTQHNLLVADNFTRGYAQADAALRREYEARSWGRTLAPSVVEV